MYKLNPDHEYLGFYDPEKKKNYFIENNPSTGNIMICNAKIIKLPKEIQAMSFNNMEWIRGTNSKLPRIVSKGIVCERLSRISDIMEQIAEYDGGDRIFITENLRDYEVEITRIINVESGETYEIPESQYQVVYDLSDKLFKLEMISGTCYIVNEEGQCFGIIEQYHPVQIEIDFENNPLFSAAKEFCDSVGKGKVDCTISANGRSVTVKGNKKD